MKHVAVDCFAVILVAANLYLCAGGLYYAWWSLKAPYREQLALGFFEILKISTYKLFAWPWDMRNKRKP